MRTALAPPTTAIPFRVADRAEDRNRAVGTGQHRRPDSPREDVPLGACIPSVVAVAAVEGVFDPVPTVNMGVIEVHRCEGSVQRVALDR